MNLKQLWHLVSGAAVVVVLLAATFVVADLVFVSTTDHAATAQELGEHLEAAHTRQQTALTAISDAHAALQADAPIGSDLAADLAAVQKAIDAEKQMAAQDHEKAQEMLGEFGGTQ